MTRSNRNRALLMIAALAGLALLAIGFVWNAPVLWIVGLVLAASSGSRWTLRPSDRENRP